MPSLHRRETELRGKYNSVKEPSTTLKRVLDNRMKSTALHYALNRQVQHICSRSCSWDDGEVTIYDKALVHMYEEGVPIQNIGLLELFLTEFMGLNLCHSVAEEEATVTAFLAAHTVIHSASSKKESPRADRGRDPQNPYGGAKQDDTVIFKAEIKGERKVQDDFEDMGIPKNETESKDDKQASSRKEFLLENLVQVYQAAKADYYLGDADKTGVSTKKTDKFSNVRFLRDSSENLLRWMRSEGYQSHPLQTEVQKVADASRGHAEYLAGCKRNYEQREDGSYERSHRHTHKRRRWDRGVDSYRPGN